MVVDTVESFRRPGICYMISCQGKTAKFLKADFQGGFNLLVE